MKVEIADKGHDTVDFANYLLEKKGKKYVSENLLENLENGTEIDMWTLEELRSAVADFQSRYSLMDGKMVKAIFSFMSFRSLIIIMSRLSTTYTWVTSQLEWTPIIARDKIITAQLKKKLSTRKNL